MVQLAAGEELVLDGPLTRIPFTRGVNKRPNNARAHNNLAAALGQRSTMWR